MQFTQFRLSTKRHSVLRYVVRIFASIVIGLLLELSGRPAFAANVLDRPITLAVHKNTILEDALIEWGTRVGVTVMMNTPTVSRPVTEEVVGTFSAREALRRILGNSGLSYTEEGGRIRVVQLTSFVHSSLTVADAKPQPASSRNDNTALVEPDLDHSRGLSEVVVTAEKREERLQDVPVPVSSISAPELAENNQLRLQDYFAQVPGFYVVPTTGNSILAIRGLTTAVGNPTVAVTIDDVPFGASTSLGGNLVPDIDPGELARVEVLRGPQGTLYGASSLGGLIKYVTIDPSMQGTNGYLSAGISDVHNGAELGYNVRGAVNIPLTDTFAMRLSGFTRQDPGYIDNPLLHTDGVNETQVSGGRLAALWRPTDRISLKLSALYQDLKAGALGDVLRMTNGYSGPNLSDFQQNYIPGAGAFEHKIQAYSATLNADLGKATLTSITAYNASHFLNSGDYSFALSACCITPNYGVAGTLVASDGNTSKVTEELRLSVPIGVRFDWLLGLFYTHERSPFYQAIEAEDSSTGQRTLTAAFPERSTYAEYSVFTDLTYHLTEQFDIQFGGRETLIDQTYDEIDLGPLIPLFEGVPPPVVYPQTRDTENAFTYLVTPQFKFSPDLMIYARFASGYRPGGANATAAPFGLPTTFKPDKTKNYEIGAKGYVLDRMMSFDISAYYINWKDIQLGFLDPNNGFGFNSNGSEARSKGAELSVDVRPTTGLTVSAWITLNRAELTEPLPSGSSVYGASGDRLPFSSRFSSNASVQQEFPLGTQMTGFVGASVAYIGDRIGGFQSPTPTTPIPPRQYYPPYAKTDFRMGIKYESWDATVFATNVTDRRGILNGGLGYAPPWAFVYIQPRTLGLNVIRHF